MPTADERFTTKRDVTISCVAFHTMMRGFELSVAVASPVFQVPGGQGLSNFLFGTALRNSSQVVQQ